MTILVTGGAGFIGSAVIRHIIGNTQLSVVNLDNLTFAGNLESLAKIKLNTNYSFEHADFCIYLNCWLIHILTDYVSDGNSRVPYKESDRTAPQGVYGQTKLNGELAVQSSGCRHIILRIAWLFSEHGCNFFKNILRLGVAHDHSGIIYDHIGCPTYTQDIAKAIVETLPKLNQKAVAMGIYHYCGDKPCSWYDFAMLIFETASSQSQKTPTFVHSIKTSEYRISANRSKYSVIDCKKIYSSFGVTPSNWK